MSVPHGPWPSPGQAASAGGLCPIETGSSKPVPASCDTGCLQFMSYGLVPFWQTVNRPLLTVIGFLPPSNEMLVGDWNSPPDSCSTRNSSLNWVQTKSGYSAEKNWKSNENELAL